MLVLQGVSLGHCHMLEKIPEDFLMYLGHGLIAKGQMEQTKVGKTQVSLLNSLDLPAPSA